MVNTWKQDWHKHQQIARERKSQSAKPQSHKLSRGGRAPLEYRSRDNSLSPAQISGWPWHTTSKTARHRVHAQRTRYSLTARKAMDTKAQQSETPLSSCTNLSPPNGPKTLKNKMAEFLEVTWHEIKSHDTHWQQNQMDTKPLLPSCERKANRPEITVPLKNEFP